MPINFKSLLKRNRLLHFLITYYRDKQFRRAFNSYLKSKPLQKNHKQIQRELNLIRKYWGCPPYHYYLYKLYEKNLSDEQLLDYVAPFYYTNIYWAERHIGLNKSLYDSKFFQHQLFARLNIPSLDIIAMINGEQLTDFQNNHLTFDDLITKYLKNENSALFLKPEYGAGGSGIIKLYKKEGQLYLNNTLISSGEIYDLLPKNKNYLIQERFVQSAKMTLINEYTVNTLRICTQAKGNEIFVPLCILRMGIKNSFIDNFCAGGLVAIVDVNDGSLSDYAQTKELDRKYYEHPDSHFVFKGQKIENWHEIKALILKYSRLISECKDLGWDVAIGDDGIKIIEINVQQGLDHQLVYNGFRKVLNIFPENEQGIKD
ncbi:MAG: hypothetical protein JXB49_11105 [Bacteroidales bacterium]|nr:hypothetical protein [Bacteroidales bacterium]